MATKAVAKKTKKKSTTAAPAKKKTYKKKKGFLGDMMNPTMATNAAKAMVASGGGGMLATEVHYSMIPTRFGLGGRILASLAIAFVGHTILQSPNLASGFLGGSTALMSANKRYSGVSLNDGEADYVNQNALKDAPLFLDEDGNTMYMDEYGDTHYLNEEQLNELAEDVDFIEV